MIPNFLLTLKPTFDKTEKFWKNESLVYCNIKTIPQNIILLFKVYREIYLFIKSNINLSVMFMNFGLLKMFNTKIADKCWKD